MSNLSIKFTEVTMPEHDVKKGPGISFNPYPHLRPPSLPSWPRGLPLSNIMNGQDSFNVVKGKGSAKFGVLQSLADHQPDVDAIYRLTRTTPFSFLRPDSEDQDRSILAVPSTSMTPYNAQATLHFYESFWALLLPSSVHGRVSDIYRSFFTQKIFPLCGLNVGFLPRPMVMQDRNPHSYLGDFQAELDLYLKADILVEYLLKDNEKDPNKNLAQVIEALWVDMFERGYIEEKDVFLVQQWILGLAKSGYKFPDCGMKPVTNATAQKFNVFKGFGRKINHGHDSYSEDPVTECHKTLTNPSEVNLMGSDTQGPERAIIASIILNIGAQYTNINNRGHDLSNYPLIQKMPGFHNVEEVSMPMKTYNIDNVGTGKNWDQVNHEFYKEKDFIKAVDAIVCAKPAAMCQLWSPFNKATIFWPNHRYNLGMCSVELWTQLDQYLQNLDKDKSKGHTVAAGSFYDMEYLEYYTGIKPLLLDSFSRFYHNAEVYSEEPSNKILVFQEDKTIDWMEEMKKGVGDEFELVNVRTQHPNYTINDLAKHRAVILMPNSVSSFHHTQLYATAMPIFVPSLKFYRNRKGNKDRSLNGFGNDRTSTSDPYCKDKELRDKFEKSVTYKSPKHPYSPNTENWEDIEGEMYWIQMANIYHWPHHHTFDSIEDIKELLKSADIKNTHQKMVMELKLQKKKVVGGWCEVINNVATAKNKRS